MDDGISWYKTDVIGKGDDGSAVLARICAETLTNSKYVNVLREGMNGIAVLKDLPDDHYVVVHSAGGDPRLYDAEGHAASLVDRLVDEAESIGVTPVAFADVVDSNKSDIPLIKKIGHSLVERSNYYSLAIMNGENAVLGDRVNIENEANLSGTMISLLPKTALTPGSQMINGIPFVVFDHEGKAVYINSDGVGTKTELYERAGTHEKAVSDYLAMNMDDTSKIGAIVKVVSGVVEMKGDIPINKIIEYGNDRGKEMGIQVALRRDRVGDRIASYKPGVPAYNISGSVVSLIDEKRLHNPLKPNDGDALIAIRGPVSNIRSNGVSAWRKLMVKLHGIIDWHETDDGKKHLDYLAQPSDVFYPLFNELIEEGFATSVYHTSGGAFDGKLARPLAQHGLYAYIDNLFELDDLEKELVDMSGATMEDAYSTWPMGNPAFVTVKGEDIVDAIDLIKARGYEAREVSILERTEGITGVTIDTCADEEVFFSGLDKAA